VAGGDALIDPSIARRLISQFVGASRPSREEPPQLAALTPREREVLRLVAQRLNLRDRVEAPTSAVLWSHERTTSDKVRESLNKRDGTRRTTWQ
jgi:hypothetical protein